MPGESGAGRFGSRRRAALILGGVVVLAAGGFFAATKLAGGGGTTAATPSATPRPRSAAASPTPTPTATAPAETTVSFGGRDPFVSPLKPTVGPTATGSPSPGAETGVHGHTVALDDIFKKSGVPTALVTVDGTEYTVQEGDVFAESFVLNKLTSKCGDFTFGDEGFQLCIGQEVTK